MSSNPEQKEEYGEGVCVASMVECEDPELMSSYRHTESTLIYRSNIDEKDWFLVKKVFYN